MANNLHLMSLPVLGEGGGLFCHKNQSYSKSPKMDKSEVKNFPHFEGRDKSGGGGGSSATKTKVTRNRPKWINLKSKIFLTFGEGGFSADLLTLRFCQLNTVVFRKTKKRCAPKVFLIVGSHLLYKCNA